ncbi:MAG: iron-sulfur cluster assembly scaffold protein, partial [Pseudomonadota bacterium]|nr:iron-sulfur cluster assembly scaffold protein [Pseudomonadota bacterium]
MALAIGRAAARNNGPALFRRRVDPRLPQKPFLSYIGGMNAPLYNKDILRLAASIPHHQRLADPQASVEKRSPTCGSRVTADVRMADGRLAELGLD